MDIKDDLLVSLKRYLCIMQVVETILECEELGVVHRDIKDENILVSTRQGYKPGCLLTSNYYSQL
jgi:serine/threonine protein kinase